MCGIIHVMRFDGKMACRMATKRYQFQKERGKEGFGFVSIRNGKVERYVRRREENEILEELNKVESSEIMLHHRMPTSTPNMAMCAHPIKVSNDALGHDYYVIHNGVISNAETLREKHIALGFTYQTEATGIWKCGEEIIETEVKFNDSEALAIELAIDFDRPKGSRLGIGNVYGSIAFVCLQVDKRTGKAENLFFGRNDRNPLKADLKSGEYLAITSLGKGKEIEDQKLFTFNYEDKRITEEPYEIGYHYKPSTGFSTYLPLDKKERKELAKDLEEEYEAEWEYARAYDEYSLLRKRLESLTARAVKDESTRRHIEWIEERLAELDEELTDYETKDYRGV